MSWAGQREQGGGFAYYGMKLLLASYRVGGKWLFRVCLYPVLGWFFWLGAAPRRASLDYLQRLAAHAPELGLRPGLWLCWRHFIAFADMVLDKLHAWSGQPLAASSIRGREGMLQRLAAGQGGIMLTAHLGNTEVMQAFAEDIPALHLTILVHTAHAAQFNRLLGEQGASSRIRLLQVEALDAVLAADLAARVAAGEWLVIAADRVPHRKGRRDATLPVRFLGHSACLPLGPHLLALLLACPLVLACCVREQAGFALSFTMLSEAQTVPRSQRNAWLQASAQRYADELQALCRQEPLQWFNFYPFWSTPDE
ncbi:LpxL/LpxP family acyltransferase [Chitinilyticum piscinae]|uniref:Lipid A biosynthesis acyltransferase n=1 Tax=Chitinilyticum piscinae TaxID=2866724 RepID=A0A8J7FNY9_9NEIS|nr:hypothetical protein [Chitinilyticum piscinae]MBE9607821.1 hypothetical protein [Chitinilyticum piscinae]